MIKQSHLLKVFPKPDEAKPTLIEKVKAIVTPKPEKVAKKKKVAS